MAAVVEDLEADIADGLQHRLLMPARRDAVGGAEDEQHRARDTTQTWAAVGTAHDGALLALECLRPDILRHTAQRAREFLIADAAGVNEHRDTFLDDLVEPPRLHQPEIA